MGWLKRTLVRLGWRKAEALPPPPVPMAFTLYPIETTATYTHDRLVARHLGRLVHLMRAVEQGDSRAELREEIRRRQGALTALGAPPPESLEQAQVQRSLMEI